VKEDVKDPGKEDANEPPEPHVRVVDRRWWARKEGDEPADDSGARKPSYVEALERQIADQAAQLQAFAGEHRRSLDEFEQVKTRIRRDVAKEVERGKRAVLVDLLDVVDNLDRAIAAALSGSEANDAATRIVKGVELVRDQFLGKLNALGVTRVEALNQPFDATRHEAVTTTPVEPARDGLVVAVMKEGYAIGDEVLRPASVVVGTADPARTENDGR
jgi:molecular chaperone GrpE